MKLYNFQNSFDETKPRNPRHFEAIEGGGKRVANTSMKKQCLMHLEGHSHCFIHFFASKHCLGHFWAPTLMESVTGLRRSRRAPRRSSSRRSSSATGTRTPAWKSYPARSLHQMTCVLGHREIRHLKFDATENALKINITQLRTLL